MPSSKTKRSVSKKAAPIAAAAAPARPRQRGRPPASQNGVLDRRLIIACAFELSKTTPLQELSMVRVARELGVTPALIHYYLDGRDGLTSGVMNSFYGEMLREWPQARGEWRADIEAVSHRVYDTHVAYAGVAAYVVAHNRFRMVQLVSNDEPDYGIQMFERFVGVVREAGFDAQRTGMYANLLMELIISGAYATVRHRWPGDHGDLLDRAFARLNPRDYPNTHFVSKNFVHFNAGSAFTDGIKLTLSGLDLERSKLGLASPAAATPRSRSRKTSVA